MDAIRIDQEELRRVAVHESGHAVMAVIQGIPCRGVFFAYEPSEAGAIRGGRFCVPVGNSPPWKKGDYLQSAAGTGAEKLFFGGYNRSASEDDRQMFNVAGAPEWEATVEEAKTVLAGYKEKIALMAEEFVSKYQQVPLTLWPDRGMNGKSTRFKEILSEEVVRQIAESDSATEPVDE
jgi:hypothetical protein